MRRISSFTASTAASAGGSTLSSVLDATLPNPLCLVAPGECTGEWTGDVSLKAGDVALKVGDVSLKAGDVALKVGDVALERRAVGRICTVSRYRSRAGCFTCGDVRAPW